jgi:hypothetical protein
MYAHSQEELRFTDRSFKTAMCSWYSKGQCRNGETCRFAHSPEELQGTHGDKEDKVSKAASQVQADKANQEVDDNLFQDSSNDVGYYARRGAKSTRCVARGVTESKMTEARKVRENLPPMAENIDHQPMFIHLPAYKYDMSDWDVPAKVYSKGSKESRILDSILCPLGLQLDSMDFNIIPDTWSFEQDDEYQMGSSFEVGDESQKISTEVQESHPTHPNMSSLAKSVQDLSRQVSALQLSLTSKHLLRHNAMPGGQTNSDSTKSGSIMNFESIEESPPCTPRTLEERLSQVSQFSKDLQSASVPPVGMFSDPSLGVLAGVWQ